MYTVYIIYSQRTDRYYIGYSSNVIDRLRRHNSHSKGFTAAGKPWTLVYREDYNDKKEAEEREKQLKGWKNRSRIKALIEKGSEHPDTQVSGGS